MAVCGRFNKALDGLTLTGREGDHTVGTRGPEKRGKGKNVTTDSLKPSEGKDPYLGSVTDNRAIALTRVRKPNTVGRV